MIKQDINFRFVVYPFVRDRLAVCALQFCDYYHSYTGIINDIFEWF